MPSDILIYGTGGTSRDVVDTLEAANAVEPTWNILGFLDDNAALAGAEVYGYPVLGGAAALEQRHLGRVSIVIAVANDRQLLIRKTIRERLALPDERFPAVIHPSACISPKASIGAGVVILSGSFCAGYTRVGRHVVVLQNCVLSHDSDIGDYCSLSLSVSLGGSVRISEGSYIGLGAMLLPGVRIGAGALVGMGAVVIRDVPAGSKVVGNPARVLPDKRA